MDQILKGLEGVTGIGDDICVYGENNEDHDRNLTNLMERAQEEGLVFKVPHQTKKYIVLWKHIHRQWNHTGR